MFEDVFKRKKVNIDRLPGFGFVRQNNRWYYETKIKDDAFLLHVTISDEGEVNTDLIEEETGEPYVLYKTNASGTYVGEIRSEIESFLCDIADICYESAVFKTRQADIAIRFVRDTYGDELKFLWTKFPDNAVWRRKDNEKWYGAILTVIGRKIGLDTDKTVEIIDLRMNAGEKDEILSRKGYYPGWHMNKNSWYTLVLDDVITDEELQSRIAESYELASR